MNDSPIAPSPASEPALTYELAFSQLESIVSRLESGDVSLDDSVSLYQRGMELAKFCSAQLESIEKKISQLIVAPDGTVTENSFGEVDV